MNFIHKIWRVIITALMWLKKIILWSLYSMLLFFGVLFAVSAFRGQHAGFGIHYFPTATKEVFKSFLIKKSNVHSFATSKLLWTYAQLVIKPLFRSHDDLYQHDMFDLTVVAYNPYELRLMFSEIFIEECYFFKTNNNTPFIIDCGGNIGIATLYFKKLYPSAEIIVFEPEPHSFALLQQNIMTNNLTHIKAINRALSDKKGNCFFNDQYKGSTGAHLIFKQGVVADSKTIPVAADVLSAYITKPVDLLKLDVEGAEGFVLKELASTGKLSYIKKMIIEFHPHCPMPLGKFLAILENHGFDYRLRKGQQALIINACCSESSEEAC
jgi:FkbM family methyltransferase